MSTITRRLSAAVVLCACVSLSAPRPADAQTRPADATAVTVAENAGSFTLSNGIVVATVSKRSGDITSLAYKGTETLANNSGHAGGYWSHSAAGGTGLVTKITIDPATTNGDRGEVSVKGISGGNKMGRGAPGAAADGDFPADIEIRYALGRGDSGVYTYCTFDHLPEYNAATMTEARFAVKLAAMFNWMTLDSKKDMSYPATLFLGDKYIYTCDQFDRPAYGWSSTDQHIGFWILNPTVEYLSGGPTKVEFLVDRDTTAVAAPVVYNYWRSSHYGGAFVDVAKGEHWTKVIGPFMLYVNSGGDHTALFQDALAQAARETKKWPYNWVNSVDYPLHEQRGTVSGQLVLNDPQATGATTPNLRVGLAAPDYPSPIAPQRPGAAPRTIDWQTDAKHYEFWVRGNSDGSFSIPDVRPGTYTLHAFTDGVLGEFAKTNVTVEAGKPLELGKLEWVPVRHGKQVWDIGIPNRNGSEFFKAEDYNNPDAPLNYIKLFPDDITYTIGKSDFRKDWYFMQVPHSTDPNAVAQPFTGIQGNGRATPYTVNFDMPTASQGVATLRLAICGTNANSIQITVNGQAAGSVRTMPGDNGIIRHAIQGMWYERDLAFDAHLMKQGANSLALVVPAGPVNSGVIYDYIRLELDESAKPATQP